MKRVRLSGWRFQPKLFELSSVELNIKSWSVCTDENRQGEENPCFPVRDSQLFDIVAKRCWN
jgi:hypothetical protein